MDAACGHAGGSIIRTDATAARSLDKMATDATDFAQDRHTHGHTGTDTDTEENTRETERDTGRHKETERDTGRHRETERQRERDKRRKGRAGPKKKSPQKNLYTKNRGSLGFRV